MANCGKLVGLSHDATGTGRTVGNTEKPVSNDHSKIGKTKVLKTDDSFCRFPCSGSDVECLTRDRGVAGLSLTSVDHCVVSLNKTL